MLGTKKYKYRVDAQGKCGIKEEIKRIKRVGEYSRVTVSIGITDKLEQKGRAVFKKGILKEEEGKAEGVYYLLEEIVYIVTIRYEVRADGSEDTRVTMIHVPEDILTDDEIVFRLVTQDFSEEVKEQIIENTLEYIKEQL